MPILTFQDLDQLSVQEILAVIAAGGNATDPISQPIHDRVLVSSTPTLPVAGAYVANDYVGPSTTPASFANVVKTAGAGGLIRSVTISDNGTAAAVAYELWLFSATFAAPTDNAAWAVTDAEAKTVQAVIPIATTGWYASANNKVFHQNGLAIPFKPAATTLFYGLVTRGAPTLATGDLTITLGIERS